MIMIKCSLGMIVYLTFSLTVESTNRPLDEFVNHFEYVHYDQEILMHNHHRLRRSNSREQSIKLSFSVFDRQYDLNLYPDDQYFHKSASFYNSNRQLSKSQIKSYLYSGHDEKRPSVKVMGSLAFGVFDGKIKDGSEIYYIEPSHRYMNESEADSHSIVYRKSDVDMSKIYKDHPEATPCGVTTRSQQRTLASLMQQHSISEEHSSIGKGRRLNKRQNTQNVRCSLNVIADYKFYSELTTSSSTTAVREAQAASLIRMIIGDGSENFENQDFDEDGTPDGIQFSIFNLTVETEPPADNSPFNNDFLGAAAYLDAHSSEDWSQFCLSYRFTYRDFDQGVLGLAYVAATGSRGGICDNVGSDSQTFNTGIVTLLNFNARISNVVAGLTFTHEAGHNFGSQHDPATTECQPSDSNGGKYVMFDRANDGSRSNNRNFSPCSRRMMQTQIENRGQNDDGCFISAENDCGNDLVDEGEACDCGLDYDQATSLCNNDPCCNGTSCKLANDVDCSPSQGDCCFSNCTFVDDGFLCRDENECALAQTCNGSSAICPVSEPVASNNSVIMCTTPSNMTRFCMNGVCEGSICIPLGLDDCECTEVEKQCHVCCVLTNGMCESTITIAADNDDMARLLPGGVGQVLEIGFPCNDFNGYCNFFNMCQLIDTNGALRRITNAFLNNEAVQSIVQFFSDYWWAPIVAAVVFIIAMFLLVLCCHFILPRPKHMKTRADRRKSIRQSRRGRNRVNHGYSGYPQTDQIPMESHAYY